VRRGLLTPETNGKGGRNPYQVFTAEQVRAAKFICTAQSLGLSLKDLAAIGKERQAGLTPEFSIAILSASSASWRREQRRS
jgi:MerR family copper efflux transcriptional regulator